MKIDAKSVLTPTITLFLICVIVTGLLAGTNAITKDQIAIQQAETERASRAMVLSAAADFEEGTITGDDGEFTYYTGVDSSGNTVGYVFTTEAKGYGGTVQVMTGIDVEGKVSGVVILSHDETPGLGANAEKEDFRNRYVGQSVSGGPLSVVKSGEAGEGQILAITGATVTSNAVTSAVNQAAELYSLVEEG